MFKIDLPTTCSKDVEALGALGLSFLRGQSLSKDESEAFLNRFRKPNTGEPALFDHVNSIVSQTLVLGEAYPDSDIEMNYDFTGESEVVTDEGLLYAAVRRIAMSNGYFKPIIVNSERVFLLG